MKAVRYNKKKGCMFCPDCQTYEVSCVGSGTLTIPTGFGFLPGDHKFSIGGYKLKGWIGVCEKCHKEVMNYTSKRSFKKFPKLGKKAS